MERPTAYRLTGTRQPASTSGIQDRRALPVVQHTDVAERHDSGRSAVVSLLGDRSAAVLHHLEHRWVVSDLLGSLVGLLVPERLGVKRSRVQIPAARLESAVQAALNRSTATSGIFSGGPKPCSASQRTLDRHRNDRQARMRSQSTSVS